MRAFAAHPRYRELPEVEKAGWLLKGRFFKEDVYTSRQAVDYWHKLQFPFWWTSLLTVMDSLARMNFPLDAEIHAGLDWFIRNQALGGT